LAHTGFPEPACVNISVQQSPRKFESRFDQDLTVTARNTTRQWGWIAQSFHWLIATLVAVNMILGWIAADLRLSPRKLELFLWHKSVGLTVLGLAGLRLLWRLSQVTPEIPVNHSPWQQRLARMVHLGLYLFLFAVPLSGWLLNSAANVPLRWFGWFEIPALIEASKPLKTVLTNWHHWLFWALAILIVLHAGAALKHHFVDRDQVLRRMLPW